MTHNLFQQIDNTVLDLQASHFQTYEAALKKLARQIRHEDLQAYNEKLTRDVRLEDFLEKSEKTLGGMVGSGHLEWTDNDETNLGLQFLLIQEFGKDDKFTLSFGHSYFYSSGKIINTIHNIVRNLIIPFVRDYKLYIHSQGQIKTELKMPQNNKVFVVHGHDNAALQGVARYLEKHSLEVIILHEQASQGKTIIEKIEANSDVGFAVVLLTPDDLGKAKSAENYQPRARQNVILELGYFIGKLGRERVCALKSDELEIPSDYMGVVWTPMDSHEAWKFALGKELKAAGYEIDMNNF